MWITPYHSKKGIRALQEFEEVRNHQQEMLKVGAVRKSVSPWASPMVASEEKGWIVEAYSLPQIEESLDCLNGAIISTSLDLKAGYWGVEMDEDSIPLTAFTVGPLGFYEVSGCLLA